jgi:hypothetical protein
VQDVVPATHGFELVEQARPAVHAVHVPVPLHTRFVPQAVPAAIAVAVSTHVWVPVAHDVVPATHGFGLVEQASPAVHETHVPPLQTMFVPQDVPFAIAVVVSTQVCWPVAHEVVPATHLFGFVEQATPAVHEVQVEL